MGELKKDHMDWIILIASGVLEAVWATALGQSNGLTRFWPSVVFLVTMIVSLLGLGFAMRTLPTGTAYAIWTAIGAALTVTYAMITGAEPVSSLRIVLLLGLVGCVFGLKVLS